jgi:hypothetical protein
MGRGYKNAGIPPGMVRDIGALLNEEVLGYKNMTEVVKDGTRLWLVLISLSRNLEKARGPRLPDEGRR